MSTAEMPHQHIAATLWKPAYARPEIHGIEPVIVTPGATVVITGKNLHYITSVRFAGVEAASFEANTEGTRIMVSAPDHLPTTGGEVSVTAAGGVAGGLTYTLATPPTGLGALHDHVVVIGHGLTLSATAVGNPAPVYYWEVLTSAGAGWERVQEDNIHSVLDDGTLRIATVDGTIAQWRYRFVADNGIGVPAISPTTAGILLNAENPIPHPIALEIDRHDRLYAADDALSCIQQIGKTGSVSIFAGSALKSGTTNGQGGESRFDSPSGLTISKNGLLIVSDAGNSNLRSITADGITHDFAGRAKLPGASDDKDLEANFDGPAGISSDNAGNIYVADAGNHTIRLITPEGLVKTLAGNADDPGGAASGPVAGRQARFRKPKGILAHTSGTIYVADTENHVIRAIAPEEPWNVSIVAGLDQTPGSLNGNSDLARFDSPQGMAEDVFDRNIIYIADTDNSLIRKLDLAQRTVSTLAGRETGVPFHGYQNARGASAMFDHPSDVVMSLSGTLFVADTGNAMIRQIDGAGNVSTFSPLAAPVRPDGNPVNETPPKSPSSGGGSLAGIYFLSLMILLCTRLYADKN
jgi:sugar lactone lactonase YvrE